MADLNPLEISYQLNEYLLPSFPIPQVLEKERKRSRNGGQDADSEDEEEDENEAQETPRPQRKRFSVILNSMTKSIFMNFPIYK